MKTRHHVAVQMEEEQQWVKDNGHIVKTADQLWKYSGETEETDPHFLNYLKEQEKQSQLKLKLRIRYSMRKKLIKTLNKMINKKLPKWFIEGGGEEYKKGDVVKNSQTGETTVLSAYELSMWDFLSIGKAMTMMNNADPALVDMVEKEEEWFKESNENAFKILIKG